MDPAVILWIVWAVLAALMLLFGLGLEVLRNYSTNRLRDVVRERRGATAEETLAGLEARLSGEDTLVSATQHWLTLVELGMVAVLTAALDGVWSGLAACLVAAACITIAAVVLLRRGIAGALAEHRAEEVLLRLLPVLTVAAAAVRPLTAVERFLGKVVSRLLGVSEDRPSHEAIQEEILDAVDEGEREGVLAGDEAAMIGHVMELTERDVREVMTPRTDIVWIPATATLHEAAAVVTRSGHSRIPVYSGSRDNVVGMLYAKDLIVPLTQEDAADRSASDVVRQPLFVPETKPVWQLLQELRQSKVHAAIVVDEYGGTAGLITVEDILEEVVGYIADEYDRGHAPPFKRVSDTAAEVDARMRVDELNDELNVAVPEEEDYDTVGGLAFTALGRVPEVGERFRIGGVDFTIIAASEHRIERLRVESQPEALEN